MNNVAIAPLYEDVGGRFGQLHPARDCEQMRLTLRLSDRDKIVGGQARRLREHRVGDRDFRVVCETPDDFARRVLNGSEALAELRQTGDLDIAEKASEDVVENVNLFFTKMRRV